MVTTIVLYMIDFEKYPIPRVRHHTSSRLYSRADALSVLPNQYPSPIQQANWNDWFTNGKPASVLDIGCGRGRLLLEHALTFPHHNILGIELRRSLVEWTQNVISGEAIPNASVLFYTVVNGLDWIEAESIDYCLYFFPDPWPKTRHAKRRAFSSQFLEMLHRIVKPGGRVHLATDRPDVDEYQRKVIASDPRWVLEETEWAFPFKTDQQLFSERKGIPYVTYSIVKAPLVLQAVPTEPVL